MRACTKASLGAVLAAGFLFSLMASMPVSAAGSTQTWDPTLGWDFQCHTHTHPYLGQLTADEIRWEMEQVNAAFQAHGYATPTHIAYPYGDGYSDEMVRAVLSEYRSTARMVWGFMMTYPVTDWYQMKAAQLKKATGWNRIVGWVEDCIADKALLHIFSHDVKEDCSQYGTTPDKLAQVLDYVIQKQNAGLLTIVTMAEAYDYWSTATEGKAMVVISFDDACVTDYTTVYPMFQERGLKGTSYIVTGWVGEPDRLTWEMIDEMRTGGQQPPKPDLTLTSDDIAFTPEAPEEGEAVTVSARIHNIGDEDASNVKVSIYDGAPNAENLIGTDTIATIVSGGTGTASNAWTAVAGDRDIYVVADPNDTISESNENNNEAFKTITVSGGVMHVANIEMSYSKQGPFCTAHAKVTVFDDHNAPVEGATVYGGWSGAFAGDVSGVTDANGQVILDSGKVKGGGTFTFTVTDLVKTGWTYDPTKNVETSDTITCP